MELASSSPTNIQIQSHPLPFCPSSQTNNLIYSNFNKLKSKNANNVTFCSAPLNYKVSGSTTLTRMECNILLCDQYKVIKKEVFHSSNHGWPKSSKPVQYQSTLRFNNIVAPMVHKLACGACFRVPHKCLNRSLTLKHLFESPRGSCMKISLIT